MPTVPVVRLPHALDLPLPERATALAAGMDLRAAVPEPVRLEPGQRVVVPCGIALGIPPGWEGQVRPRSGLAVRHGVTVLNSPGTIDADYRGEVCVPLVNLGADAFVVSRGERIAQIVFARCDEVTLDEVEVLPPSPRGTGGFGSTGRR